jgi:hypothetical protein
MNTSKYIVSFLTLILSFGLSSQNQPDETIFKAMTDEMSRNLTELKLGQNQPPFFIADYFCDAKIFYAKASLGGLLASTEAPMHQPNARLMMGNYAVNDENFVGTTRSTSYGVQLALPKEYDYMAIRRSFWSMFDTMYKNGVDGYLQKLSAMKQQNKDDIDKLDDYTRISPIVSIQPTIANKYNKTQWENNIKELSAVFGTYKGIQASSVDLMVYSSDNYLVNSEGTKVKTPLNVACLMINASTQSVDGEVLRDFVLCYSPLVDQLPSMNEIKDKINKMAGGLQNRIKSPVVKEAYQGPVVIEEDALAELFNIKFFGNDGLIAKREPIYATSGVKTRINNIANKIGKRLCSENITVTATPKVTMFGKTPLVGSFTIDSEGVIPDDELRLVDNGILKTLLNDRVPSDKVRESNGYSRFLPFGTRQKAPGVINITYKNGSSYADLIKHVTEETIKNGLDYFYIIRKFETSNFGQNIQNTSSGLAKPVIIVKVMVKTGEEQIVRCATISDFPLLSFKYALGGTTEQVVYNSMSQQVPVSYIVPKALAFNDISIEKDNSPKSKLPIVPSPSDDK